SRTASRSRPSSCAISIRPSTARSCAVSSRIPRAAPRPRSRSRRRCPEAIGLLLAFVGLADRSLVTNLVPLPKPPILLVERAKQILAMAGQEGHTVDAAHGFVPANFLGYLGEHPNLLTPERLRSGDPATLHFWYRGSPVVMVPTGDQDRVSQTDPPMTVARMSMVQVDPDGRLVSMAVVPPQVDPPAPPKPQSGE